MAGETDVFWAVEHAHWDRAFCAFAEDGELMIGATGKTGLSGLVAVLTVLGTLGVGRDNEEDE